MQDYKIITIKGPNNSEVTFCPKRGGIITSLKLKGKEIFYFDEETFNSKDASIRGGIPILFPNMGELKENSLYPNLKRHGFARNSEWTIEETEKGFKESLSSNKEIKKIYPFDFNLSVSGKFNEDGSFTLNQEIENKETKKDLPISMGLHPYLKIPVGEKKNIKFNFEGGKSIEEQINIWGNGGTVYVDNPKVEDPNAVIEIVIPALGTLFIDPSPQYKKIWIWSLPGKDFVCIEPAMRELNGLIDNPELISSKNILNLSLNFYLK